MAPFTSLVPVIVLAVAIPALAQQPEPMKARLDAMADAYANIKVNAVVLIGHHDKIVYEKAFGYADLDKKIPLAVGTRFKTESVGKIFTSTRIMQLVEQGKLKLDDPATKYLQGWNIPDLDKITIHQLLNHTAGLRSPWDHPNYDFSKAYTPAELKRIIEEVTPVSKPGGKYYYSNSGYYLLGEIIAAVTGRSYDADTRQAIFGVAHMANTDHLNATRMPANAAQPYIFHSSTEYRPFNVGVSPRAIAAGGWVSNAHDLYKFAQNYQDGKFISLPTRKVQWSANGTADLSKDGRYYGYGTEVHVNTLVPGKTIVGHTGGGGGFSVDMFVEPESGYVVVTLSNAYAMNRAMSTNFLNAALGLPTRPAAQTATVRAVDHLQLKGLAYFQKDPAAFFKEIDIPKASPGLLEEIEGSLREIRQNELADGVAQTAKMLAGAPKT
ncbi:MAG TPA: serine hydrolase domain-containing protein [Telluria sp.]|nr:serine hydrolase domain-containing protein [Telluria sp.]